MKKLLCALLAVVMVMSLLIGCGSTEAPAEETKTEAPAETKKEEPAKEEAKEETKEEAPAEWSEETWLPLSTTGEVVQIMRSENAKVPDYTTHNFTKWVQEVTGVTIEWYFLAGSTAEKQQQLSLMVAGGERIPDIIWFQTGFDIGFVNDLGKDGYLVDLSQYMYTDLMPYWNKAIAGVSEKNQERYFNFIKDPDSGAIYTLPHYQDLWVWDNAGTIGWINTKWLETLGMEKPTSIDELHDVLVAFKEKDPNGNGKADEIPMFGNNLGSGGNEILPYIINAYVYFDSQSHLNATDGQIWAPFASDEYREACKTLNAWFAEGLIAQQCFTGVASTDAKPIITPEDEVPIVGFWCGHSSVVGTQENPVFFEYEYQPALTVSETDKGGHMVWRPGGLYVGSMVSADCENLELVIKFCDWFFSDTATASMRHGLQGKNWEWLDPNQTDRAIDNIAVIDDGQAFFNGVDTWGGNTHAILTNNNYLNGAVPATEWLQHEHAGRLDCEDDARNENWPEEVVNDIVYTSEEREYVNSVKQLFKDYIAESLAKFGTGVWDPNNDADWNTYLSELETMGLPKYLETAQTAYTRMNTK